MAADIDQSGKIEAHLRSRCRGRGGQHLDVADRHDDGQRGHGQARGPAATLRVVPWWIYQDGGKLAVIADSSQRGDVRVISSKLLPRPVRMSKGSSLLIKITGKTKPGKYAIALRCEDKHNQPDSVDVKTVRIYKVLGASRQPDQPGLPSAFKPDVTVSSGPPAAHPKPGHKGH